MTGKICHECSDINILNDMFVEKVGKVLDTMAPLKNYQIRRNYINWLTEEIKLEMKNRDLSRELARRTGEAEHWADYRRRRNKCMKKSSESKN